MRESCARQCLPLGKCLYNSVLIVRLTCFALVFSVITSCALDSMAPEATLQSQQVCVIGSGSPIPLTVELARSKQQKRRGLMARDELSPDHGMLFVFDSDQSPDHAFWMYRTTIPLDIAYLDREGLILAVRRMEPCHENRRDHCPLYEAGVSYRFALEVNQGFFLSFGVGPGDRIDLNGSSCADKKTSPPSDSALEHTLQAYPAD